jgi:phosphatidylglycerol:prolipoprotein diacylglycerol transferase
MRERLINTLPQWMPGSWLIPDSSLVWALALLVVLALSILYAHRGGLSPKIMVLAGVWGILGAHWGGHLLKVLATPQALIEDPFLFFNFLVGEKKIYGAFLGAGFFSWLYLRWKSVSFLDYVDSAVPAVALGYAIARIGCFLNGCCYGTLSDLPWAVRFPYGTEAFATHFARGLVEMDDALSLPVHPTQLYHAAAGLILFLMLRRWQEKRLGSRLTVAMLSYGAIRFALQFVRGDATPVLGFLDVNQIFILLFILFAGLLWWRLGREQTASRQVMPALASAESLYRGRLQCGLNPKLK